MEEPGRKQYRNKKKRWYWDSGEKTKSWPHQQCKLHLKWDRGESNLGIWGRIRTMIGTPIRAGHEPNPKKKTKTKNLNRTVTPKKSKNKLVQTTLIKTGMEKKTGTNQNEIQKCEYVGSRGRGRSPTTAAHCSDVRYPSGLLFWADSH